MPEDSDYTYTLHALDVDHVTESSNFDSLTKEEHMLCSLHLNHVEGGKLRFAPLSIMELSWQHSSRGGRLAISICSQTVGQENNLSVASVIFKPRASSEGATLAWDVQPLIAKLPNSKEYHGSFDNGGILTANGSCLFVWLRSRNGYYAWEDTIESAQLKLNRSGPPRLYTLPKEIKSYDRKSESPDATFFVEPKTSAIICVRRLAKDAVESIDIYYPC